MKKFLNTFKNYFDISTYERRGVFTLLFCIVLVIGYHYIKKSIVFHRTAVSQEAVDELNAMAEASLIKKEERLATSSYSPMNESEPPKKQHFPFDPNNDTYEQLVQKGVPAYVAKNMVNYRSKGGYFRTKQDVLKLYVVDNQLFAQLEPFIQINEKVEVELTESAPTIVISSDIQRMVEVNTASKDELLRISGIGNYYADKIIKQRESLGGFYDLNQVQVLFQKHPDVFEEIQPYLIVDTATVQKLDINQASFDELRKHPLFTYNEAKSITNFIRQHGEIGSFQELNELHIYRGKNIRRLKPYIGFK